jgi:hypothetical protein
MFACLKMLNLCAQAYAEAQSFQLGDRIYHADDHVVGQYYIALAEHFNLSEAVVPVTTTFEEILSNPSSVDLNHSVPGKLYISLNQLLHPLQVKNVSFVEMFSQRILLSLLQGRKP